MALSGAFSAFDWWLAQTWIVSWMKLTGFIIIHPSRRIAQNYWHIYNKRMKRKESEKVQSQMLLTWLIDFCIFERVHAAITIFHLSNIVGKIVHENRRSYRQFIAYVECLPAHSTFNHFRSIIFQHAALSLPSSLIHDLISSHLCDARDIKSAFFYYLQNDQRKRWERVKLCEYVRSIRFFFLSLSLAYKISRHSSRPFYVALHETHQTDFFYAAIVL